MKKKISILFILFCYAIGFSQTIDTLVYSEKVDTVRHYDNEVSDDVFYKLNLKTFNSHPAPSTGKNREVKLIEPQTFVMSNGLTIILVENHKLPIVSYKLFFDINKTQLGPKKGSDLIFNDIWGKKGSSFTSEDVEHYKKRYGSVLEIKEDYIYVEGLTRHKYNHMSMISDLSLDLNISQEDFDSSRDKLKREWYFNSRKNRSIVNTVGETLMFGRNNPFGEQLNIDFLDSLNLSDVKNYYNNYYNPSNGFLVVYGDVTLRELKKMTNLYFRKFKKRPVRRGYYSKPYNLQNIEIDFVSNYMQDSVSVWMANIEDAGTQQALWVYNRFAKSILFEKDFALFKTQLSDKGIISNLGHKLSVTENYFSVSFDTHPNKLSEAIRSSLDILRNTTNSNFGDNLLERVKTDLNIEYIEGLHNPHVILNFYLLYYLTGSDEFLMPNFTETIKNMNNGSISKTLKSVIKPDQMRIVVSGPPNEAVLQLEKLNYKIAYYDQIGEPTYPPSLDRPVPDSISVDYVLDRYQRKLGDKLILDNVKKMLQWYELRIGEEKLYVKNKYMLPYSRLSTISNKEVIVMKTVNNSEFGYTETGGSINEYSSLELAKLLTEKSIFPVRFYKQDGYFLTVESKVPLKGELCYKLRSEAPFGEVSFLYFSVDNGNLIKREIIDPVSKDVVNYFEYSDFKNFEGVQMPYKISTTISGRDVELVMTQIEFNPRTIKKRNFD